MRADQRTILCVRGNIGVAAAAFVARAATNLTERFTTTCWATTCCATHNRLRPSSAHRSRQHDDRVAARAHPDAEELEGAPAVDRKGVPQMRGRPQELPRACVRPQQQDHAVHAPITLLEREPSGKGLLIAGTGLGLDAVAPRRRPDQCVPGALIAG